LKVGRKEVLGGEEHEIADLEGILETMLVGFGGVLVLCFADLLLGDCVDFGCSWHAGGQGQRQATTKAYDTLI
jgi:hypothetical protein